MKNTLRKRLLTALALAAVCGCCDLSADNVTKSKLGKLHRSDEVVTDVKFPVDTNSVQQLISNHYVTVVVPRIDAIGYPVQSVNGKTGTVVLATGDIPGAVDTNDVIRLIREHSGSGGVPATPHPVESVNGQTGTVVLTAGDVGAATASEAADIADARIDAKVPGIVRDAVSSLPTGDPGGYLEVSNRAMSAVQPQVHEGDYGTARYYPDDVQFDYRSGVPFDFSDGGEGIPYRAYIRPQTFLNGSLSWLLPLRPDTDASEDILLARDSDVAAVSNDVAELQKVSTALANSVAALSEATWSSPGLWSLEFAYVYDMAYVSDPVVRTNSLTGVITSERAATQSSSLYGYFYTRQLDPKTMRPAPRVSVQHYNNDDEQVQVYADNYVNSGAPGVYEFSAVTPDGQTRKRQVPFQASNTPVTDIVYTGDSNTVRRSANDSMHRDLAAASLGLVDEAGHDGRDAVLPGDTAYPEDGSPSGVFKAWHTCYPAWVWRMDRGFIPWAVASKVLVADVSDTVKLPVGYVTLYDMVYNREFTVRVGAWDRLDEWVRRNRPDIEIPLSAGASYVVLGEITEGEVPELCLPCLAGPDEIDALFGGTLDGVMAWHAPSATWCVPALLDMPGSSGEAVASWTGAAYLTDEDRLRVRSDVFALVKSYDRPVWWRARLSDRGSPVFIRLGHSNVWAGWWDIPVASAHFSSGGANIPALATAIRAYCSRLGCTPRSLPDLAAIASMMRTPSPAK